MNVLIDLRFGLRPQSTLLNPGLPLYGESMEDERDAEYPSQYLERKDVI